MGALLSAIAGLTLCATVQGAAADANRFDGTYRIIADHEGCIVGEGDVTGAAFRISDGRYESIETLCTLANPTNIRDMDAMLFDMQCTSEGMEWSDRIFMMLMEDGSLVRVINGFALTNPPCSEG